MQTQPFVRGDSHRTSTAPASLHRLYLDTAPASLHRQYLDTAPASLHRQYLATAPACLHRQYLATAPASLHRQYLATAPASLHRQYLGTQHTHIRTCSCTCLPHPLMRSHLPPPHAHACRVPGRSWVDSVNAAYWERVDLSAHGWYITPDITGGGEGVGGQGWGCRVYLSRFRI